MSGPEQPRTTGDGEPPRPPAGWGVGPDQPLGYPPVGGAPQPPGYGTPQPPRYGAPQPPQYGVPQYGAPQPPQHGAPQPPQYGAPQYGTQQYGTPQYGGPQGGMPAPPPLPVQRGIVPLRPLGVGEILDGAFRSVRANPRVMFGLTGVVVAATALLGIVVTYLLLPTVSRFLSGQQAALDPTGDLGLEEVLGDLAVSISLFGAIPAAALATTFLAGLLSGSVAQSVIGRTVGAGELWRRYWRRSLMTVLLSLVLGLLVTLIWTLVAVVVGVLVAVDQPVLALLLGAVAVLGAVVGTTWLLVRTMLIPPTVVLEDGGTGAKIARAWRLTRGSFWRLLGIGLLGYVIVYVVQQILAVPAGFAALFVSATGADPFWLVLLTQVSTALALLATLGFWAALIALLYVDVRIRREGLDVALARAADAAAGAGRA